MAWKKCPKAQKEIVDLSDNDFNNGSGDEEDDDDNAIDFAADGSTVVSEQAHVVNQISKNLLKLWNNVVKTLVNWSTEEPIHKEYLSKLDEFIICQRMQSITIAKSYLLVSN